MTPDEQKAFVVLAQKYKNVFHTLEGQEVLIDIVVNKLGTFRTDKETEGDMACSNVGAEILNYVSCSDADLTLKTIMRAIINVSPITLKE